MPPIDYIPFADTAFHTWQTSFVAYVNANFAALGLTVADTTALGNAQAPWKTGFPAHVAAQAAAAAATQTKDTARAQFIAHVRLLVRRLQSSPVVTDTQRGGLGITIRDTIPTPPRPPTSRPVAAVTDATARLRHTLTFRNDATPTRTARPAGVIGAEVWAAVLPQGAPPPTGAESMTFLGTATRSPFLAEFQAADAGKNAHYMLRWVNRRGARGGWSETVTATVGV